MGTHANLVMHLATIVNSTHQLKSVSVSNSISTSQPHKPLNVNPVISPAIPVLFWHNVQPAQ